jgi:1,2-diacylglycerol 3-alpha-glucosyltransferase
MRLLFLVRRVGPYHDARFDAAARLVDLTVVETRPLSKEYPWTSSNSSRRYKLRPLGQSHEPETGLRGRELRLAMKSCMDSAEPQVVACTGWADPEYNEALRQCHARGLPAIVMSDSTYDDEPRSWWKERIKRGVVGGYSAAVVAGTRSRDYLRRLGFPVDAVFEPWDVVDNDYFSTAVGRVPAATRPPFFVCISRYLAKKNLLRLIEAFAHYRGRAGPQAWDLVILGSGELQESIRAAIKAANLDEHVHLPGFVQYDSLPEYYAGAGACVLPSLSDQWGLAINEAMASGVPVLVSRACGCAVDLVSDSENGFTFDPRDVAAMADLFQRVAGMPLEQRKLMGAAGRARVGAYSLDRFAQALVKAGRFALQCGKRQGIESRLALSLLHLRN